MVVADGDFLVLPDGAALDAANGNAAHKFIIIYGGHKHLERSVHIALRFGDITDDRVEKGVQAHAGDVRGIRGGSLSA